MRTTKIYGGKAAYSMCWSADCGQLSPVRLEQRLQHALRWVEVKIVWMRSTVRTTKIYGGKAAYSMCWSADCGQRSEASTHLSGWNQRLQHALEYLKDMTQSLEPATQDGAQMLACAVLNAAVSHALGCMGSGICPGEAGISEVPIRRCR